MEIRSATPHSCRNHGHWTFLHPNVPFYKQIAQLLDCLGISVNPVFGYSSRPAFAEAIEARGVGLSSSGLLFTSGAQFVSSLDALYPSFARKEPLQTIQKGSFTVELIRYEHGGAVGPHSIYIEQRRLVVPGLYLLRIVDAFSFAHEATLSVAAPYTVKVHAKGSYDARISRLTRFIP